MKRLLFIMDTFPLGGISKSLLALFNEIGNGYDIDFLLMKKDGLFVPLIPENVNVLTEVIETEFRDPHPRNIFKNFRSLDFKRWLSWCGFSIQCTMARLAGGLGKMVCTMDEYIGKNSRAINKHYDAAIAYQGGRCIYYLVENVDSDVKIGYVHSNYSINETDYMLKPSDSKYYPMLDSLVTISQVCLSSLQKEFPKLKKRCHVVENICSPNMIHLMADKGETYRDNFNGIRLSSMGRFDIQVKGIDIAIEACKILKSKGVSFKWYWLGDGNQRKKVEDLVCEFGVQDVFILLGAKVNPYHFIKDSDIYVQPSRIEGKSVALDEVKALAKPIVVTKFASVYDQFTDKQNALICDISAAAVANSIVDVIENEKLSKNLVENLRHERVGNEDQIEVFKSLLNKKSI